MARQSFDAWVPEIWGGPVITKLVAESAVERLGRPEVMTSDVKNVPRSGGISMTGATLIGVAISEDSNTNDVVTLTARKFPKIVRVADEEIKDAAQVANIIATKQLDWAGAQARNFDNACLGVSTETPTGSAVPFQSLYAALHTTNSATDYTAEANIVVTASATPTFAEVSDTFGLVEDSNFWNDSDMIVIAHPAFRKALRNVVDGEGRHIFSESTAGFPGGGVAGAPAMLFGTSMYWSLGSRVHATATDSPTGNPLLFVGNRQYLIRGDRSGPEYMVAGADSGPAFVTDEALLKMRVRKGFACGHEKAFGCLSLAL